jgi:hypothetical protein
VIGSGVSKRPEHGRMASRIGTARRAGCLDLFIRIFYENFHFR